MATGTATAWYLVKRIQCEQLCANASFLWGRYEDSLRVDDGRSRDGWGKEDQR